MADDIATHPEIGFEENAIGQQAHRLPEAARLRRARPASAGLTTAFVAKYKAEQRRADPRRHPRIRRAARHQGRVPRRPAQRAGAGRHGRGGGDGGVPDADATRPGSVVVYGTPGEEMMPPNAKTVMHEAHVFDGADIIVRSHASSADVAAGAGLRHLLPEHRRREVHVQRRAGAPDDAVERPQRARRR